MRVGSTLTSVLAFWALVAVAPADAQTSVEHRSEARPTTSVTLAGVAPAPAAGSLRRIARGLRHRGTGDLAASSLRVDVELQVFGLAPAPALFEQAELGVGLPVYGAPTHDEMLTAVTPGPFRSTAAYRRLRPAMGLPPWPF